MERKTDNMNKLATLIAPLFRNRQKTTLIMTRALDPKREELLTLYRKFSDFDIYGSLERALGVIVAHTTLTNEQISNIYYSESVEVFIGRVPDYKLDSALERLKAEYAFIKQWTAFPESMGNRIRGIEFDIFAVLGQKFKIEGSNYKGLICCSPLTEKQIAEHKPLTVEAWKAKQDNTQFVSCMAVDAVLDWVKEQKKNIAEPEYYTECYTDGREPVIKAKD